MTVQRTDYFLSEGTFEEVSEAGSLPLSGALSTQLNPAPGGNQETLQSGAIGLSGAIVEYGIGFSEDGGGLQGELSPIGTLQTDLTTVLRTLTAGGTITPAGAFEFNPKQVELLGALGLSGTLDARGNRSEVDLSGTLGLSGAVLSQAIGIAAIVLTPSSARILEGSDRHFTATVYDTLDRIVSNPDVHWSSSDTDVMTVGPDGTVQAVAAGTADLIATVGTVSSSITIQVVEATSDGGTQPRPWGYRKRRYRGRLS